MWLPGQACRTQQRMDNISVFVISSPLHNSLLWHLINLIFAVAKTTKKQSNHTKIFTFNQFKSLLPLLLPSLKQKAAIDTPITSLLHFHAAPPPSTSIFQKVQISLELPCCICEYPFHVLPLSRRSTRAGDEIVEDWAKFSLFVHTPD